MLEFKNINNKHLQFDILDEKKLLKIENFSSLKTSRILKLNCIIIFCEGSGIFEVDFKTYNYKSGTTLFVTKNQAISLFLGIDTNFYILKFTDEFLKKISKDHVWDMFNYMKYLPFVKLDKVALELVLSYVKLLMLQLKLTLDEYKEPIILSLFESLVLQLKRVRTKDMKLLRTNDEILYQDFLTLLRKKHQYKIRVQEYATILNVSSKTLARAVKKHTDKSTKKYIDEFLLLQIKRYLSDDFLSISKVADKLNFDEITNMIKFFKNLEGITPLQFKQMILNIKHKKIKIFNIVHFLPLFNKIKLL